MRGALGLFESDTDTERWAKLRRAIDELLPGDLGDDVLPYLAHFLNLLEIWSAWLIWKARRCSVK
jgi:hypothetical protein